MAITRKIEYILVPNTKGKSYLWKHFDLLKRKTDGRTDANVAKRNQSCRRHLKHVNAHEAPRFLIVV